MNQYAGTLIVCVCFGALATVGAGCDNASNTVAGSAGASATTAGSGNLGAAGSTITSAGSGTTAGTSSVGGSSATGGSGGTTSGGSTSSAGATAAGTVVALPSDETGYVKVDTLGVQGAWYSYGDGVGADGLAASGNCQKVGMHAAAECSLITSPMFGSFENTDSNMCTTGHVAKVIALAGMTSCPAKSTACDYDNIFGAGIGIDLNNAGGDAGTGKLPLDATAAGIIGISFDIDAVPLTGLRVEFPTDTTANTAAIWKPSATKNYTSPLTAGHNVILFSDVIQPDYIKPPAKLDATHLVSIQFHVPTTTTAAADYMFCISNLSAITQ